jgi:hypothetical protein
MKPFLGIVLEICCCLAVILAGYLLALGLNFFFPFRI